MKTRTIIILSCLFAGAAFAADDAARWVTFKTGRDGGRPLEHQIDRQSIRPEGPYRVFWTRVWLPNSHQPVALSVNEAIVFWSQKFAVDCQGRRYSGDFIDSNNPHDAKKVKTTATAKWVPLIRPMEKTVCAK